MHRRNCPASLPIAIPPSRETARLSCQCRSTPDGARRVITLDPVTGQLLREHALLPRGRYTPRSETSKRTPLTTIELLGRTKSAGKSIGALAAAIHGQDGQIAVRRILGLLWLARRHGAATVDEACAAALEMGAPTYRFVRRYLERHLVPRLTLRQVDPLIRELTHYRDVIERMTSAKENEP